MGLAGSFVLEGETFVSLFRVGGDTGVVFPKTAEYTEELGSILALLLRLSSFGAILERKLPLILGNEATVWLSFALLHLVVLNNRKAVERSALIQ